MAPVLNIAEVGARAGKRGFTLPYTVQLQNAGRSTPRPIAIIDTVNGNDVAAQVTTPPSHRGGTTGTATVNAASPVGQTPGPYTDAARVTWQDRNGNVYGPRLAAPSRPTSPPGTRRDT